MENNSVHCVLLCGIPGAGKSYLSKKLIETLGNSYDKAEILEFDSLLRDELSYKEATECYFEQYNKKISSSSGNILFILDHNFAMKSHRKPFINALKTEKGVNSYVEVHLDCPIEYALENNNLREETVPEDIIVKMRAEMDHDSFREAYILRLFCKNRAELEIDTISSQIQTKLKENTPLLKIEPKREESVTWKQKLDILLRKEVSLFLSTSKTKTAKEVSKIKKEFLSNLIQGEQDLEALSLQFQYKLNN